MKHTDNNMLDAGYKHLVSII